MDLLGVANLIRGLCRKEYNRALREHYRSEEKLQQCSRCGSNPRPCSCCIIIIIFAFPLREAGLYSRNFHLDYRESLICYLIVRTLPSMPVARPVGDSTHSKRRGSMSFASPRERQELWTLISSPIFLCVELVHCNEIVGPLMQCDKPTPETRVDVGC